MAPPPGTLRVGRYFMALLALLAILYMVVFLPGQRHKPKLGIDLVGGVRVVFTAIPPKNAPNPTSSQMTQARQILEDRINGTGVTGATVVVQGNDQLVVEIPNGTGTDVDKLGKAAVLNFRGLMAPAVPVQCRSTSSGNGSGSGSPSASSSPTGSSSAKTSAPAAANTSSHAPGDAAHRPLLAAPSTSSKASTPASSTSGSAKSSASPTGSASASPSVSGSSSAAPIPACDPDPIGTLLKADPTLKKILPNAESCPSPGISATACKPFSALNTTQQQAMLGAAQRFDCTQAETEEDLPDQPYIACDNGRSFGVPVAYLLGHVVVPGRTIGSAAAQAPSVGTGGGSTQWTVSLTLSGSGADRWNAWTSKFHTSNQSVSPLQTSSTTPCGPSAAVPCSDFVGFTLGGEVISAPVTLAVLDRQTSISGNFNQKSANDLARELNYGKLPLSFRADQNQHVSATLGKSQLNAAFLAGGIGLILVVVYSLLYYRGLGLVTIASLLVSAALTYAMLVILGSQIGFTLDLAGIAGFIVALGITADSFVVFFERIKDEVHEGRSLRVAVPRAWVRARRTILSADTVSFLAAATLYYFASADVKGFAFTLGMSTILDLVVVFLFTHPIVSVLSRSGRFGSARFSGLDAVRVGGIAQSDDVAAARGKAPARASRGGRAKAAAKPALPAGDDASAVAVLDVEEEVSEAPAATGATGADTPPPADAVTDNGEAVPDEPATPRRTTPQAGSAAERAAARRARMRDQSGDSGKGES